MNTMRDAISATDSMSACFRRRIGPALLTLLGRAGFGPHCARPRGNAARRYPILRYRSQGHGELPG